MCRIFIIYDPDLFHFFRTPELIQTHMVQKSMLRVEAFTRTPCVFALPKRVGEPVLLRFGGVVGFRLAFFVRRSPGGLKAAEVDLESSMAPGDTGPFIDVSTNTAKRAEWSLLW